MKAAVTRSSMQRNTTTWRSHCFRSFARECESLKTKENEARLTHTHTRPLQMHSLQRQSQTNTSTHTHRHTHTKRPHQTTNHISITMCAQTVFPPNSNTLRWSRTHTFYSMYAMHAALSHTAPITLTQADRITSPLVTGYIPHLLYHPLSPLFSSHLSSAFHSVNLSLCRSTTTSMLLCCWLWCQCEHPLKRSIYLFILCTKWEKTQISKHKQGEIHKQMHEHKYKI